MNCFQAIAVAAVASVTACGIRVGAVRSGVAVHNVALQIGGLTIYWYGVLVALGFLAGLWTAGRRALNAGIPSTAVADLGTWLILGTLIGARGYYVVAYWREQFAAEPWWEVFMIQHGGLVFYGGLIGAFIAGSVYVRLRRLPFWRTADVLAPSIALGHFFGRWGCFLNGCCYGSRCAQPWAVRFPVAHETGGELVHPTQIYEALLNLGLYLGLAWLHRRRRFDGQVFGAYLVGYGVLRFGVEFFRGDVPDRMLWGSLRFSQGVALGLVLVGGCLLVLLRTRSQSGTADPDSTARD